MVVSPVIIQSDWEDREFINKVNNHLFEPSGVQHRISAAYHPQTNGLEERFNQTLVNALTKMTAEKPDEWDQYIDPILFPYRCVSLYIISYVIGRYRTGVYMLLTTYSGTPL